MKSNIKKSNIESAMDKIMRYTEITKEEFWDLLLLVTWAMKQVEFTNGTATFTITDTVEKGELP